MKYHRFLQGKWDVPIPKVKAVSEAEVFRVVNSGKRRSTRDELIERLFTKILLEKAWKRLVTKPCFVGEGFTRKPPKFERFIRPMVKIALSFSHSPYGFWFITFPRHCDSRKRTSRIPN